MAGFKTLDDLGEVKGKRVLVRVDLNVPVADGKVSDATRIERVAPTIKRAFRAAAPRSSCSPISAGPRTGPTPALSLAPIAEATVAGARPSRRLRLRLHRRCGRQGASPRMKDGDVLLLENTRFHKGEEKNDADFTKALAANGDIYVNDAFSAAHRAHASTEGLAHLLPAYAGRTMQAELEALEKGLGNPVRPVVAIVGGAKVSTKIDLLMNLVKKVDALVIGGGMANTFLAARGTDVGKSLCEHDLADTAKQIMIEAATAGCAIILPSDGVVAREFKANAANETVAIDAGSGRRHDPRRRPEDRSRPSTQWIDRAATLVWNGPLGAFEIAPFDRATVAAAKHAAARTKAGKLVSVAGGGDTVAALNHAGVADDFTYVSTAGGAFLEWMEGKPLPGVDVLKA